MANHEEYHLLTLTGLSIQEGTDKVHNVAHDCCCYPCEMRKGYGWSKSAIPQIEPISGFPFIQFFSSDTVGMQWTNLLFLILSVALAITYVIQMFVYVASNDKSMASSDFSSFTESTPSKVSWLNSLIRWMDKLLPDLPPTSPYSPYDKSDLLQNLYPGRFAICLLVVEIHLEDGSEVRMLASYIPVRAINHTVMVTFTDSSYLESFYSSYEISNLGQYKNLIVAAVDLKSYAILRKQGYPVAYYRSTGLSERSSNAESSFHSKEWLEKMVNKIKIIRQSVVIGYNILLFDSDVMFFQDPLPYIQSMEGFDLIAQKDLSVCAGFM